MYEVVIHLLLFFLVIVTRISLVGLNEFTFFLFLMPMGKGQIETFILCKE